MVANHLGNSLDVDSKAGFNCIAAASKKKNNKVSNACDLLDMLLLPLVAKTDISSEEALCDRSVTDKSQSGSKCECLHRCLQMYQFLAVHT